MTEHLYYIKDMTAGRAQIVHCTEEQDGRYAIELDRTLFHPQGGGQPADKGWIAGVTVEEVVQRGENIVHILARSLARGEVDIQIDAAVRDLHSRWHTAGHLIGYAGERFGWRPVKAHHWPGEGRITFIPGEDGAALSADMLKELIDGWRSEKLMRNVEMDEGRRKVWFGDLPAYLCGGTHISDLSKLGEVEISNVKQKKGQLIVSYRVL